MQRYTEGFTRSGDGTSIFWSVSAPAKTREPDLILCDGIGCDGFVWKYLAPRFAENHRVIRWHYRGHGRSRVPESLDRLSVHDLVGDLRSVLDAVESEAAVLMGHSVGVQVILETHRRHPDRVRALIPVCGSYGNPLDTFHDTVYLKQSFPVVYRALTGLPELAVRLWRYLLPSRVAWLTALVAGEVNRSLIRAEDLQPYFDHLGTMDPEVFVRMLARVAGHTARDHLPAVDVPTLVIGAELDTFTPVWLSESMAETIPDAELLIVPKGSHAAPIEQPELLALRVEKFLRERLGCYQPAPAKRSKRAKAAAGGRKTGRRRSRPPA